MAQMNKSNNELKVVAFIGTLNRLGNALKQKAKVSTKRAKNGIRSALRDLNGLLTPPSGRYELQPIPIPINPQRRRRRSTDTAIN